MVAVLCSLLTSLKLSTIVSGSLIPLVGKSQRPPGVSSYTSYLPCLIYSLCLPDDLGLPDSWVSYPAEQALYQVSVCHNKYLPAASFRFYLTIDTLAFDYGIPVIKAPSGL